MQGQIHDSKMLHVVLDGGGGLLYSDRGEACRWTRRTSQNAVPQSTAGTSDIVDEIKKLAG